MQLGVLAIGPEAELAVAQAFVRQRHDAPAVLVWIVDDGWCFSEGEFVHQYDHFPFWLYSGSDLSYAAHVFSIDAVQASFYRIGIHLFKIRPFGEIDGRWAAPTQNELREFENTRAALAGDGQSIPQISPEDDGQRRIAIGHFQLVDRLQVFIGSLSEETKVLFVFMPFAESALPSRGSRAERLLAECKARFADLARARPQTAIIDRLVENDIARDPRNFNDPTHISASFARIMDVELARVLNSMIH